MSFLSFKTNNKKLTVKVSHACVKSMFVYQLIPPVERVTNDPKSHRPVASSNRPVACSGVPPSFWRHVNRVKISLFHVMQTKFLNTGYVFSNAKVIFGEIFRQFYLPHKLGRLFVAPKKIASINES